MIELLVVAVAIFGFAMNSERLSMSPITPPMVFTTIGILVGPGLLGWFDLDIGSEPAEVLLEATLVLILFTDAIRIDLSTLRRQASLPGRLLGIGLPLTIVAGTGVALAVLPGLGLAEAALLAAVLAPTDAALGQAVVSDRRLPVRVRQGLNVESGLNDGIAVPAVTALLAVAAAEEAGDAGQWIEFAARQIGFGVLSGVACGAVGGRLLDHRAAAGAVEGIYRQLATIAVAVGAFALAGALDGNGLIAAFTAGLTFGHVARPQCRGVQDFTEDEGELLSVITFVFFGAAVISPMLDELSWRTVLYAMASLTVVRIIPVMVAMIGSGMFLETRLFLGWFGPRGLASILFAVIVLEGLESAAGRTVFSVAAWTVLASVYLHGVTASPWAGRLARRLAAETEPMPEMEPVADLPTRRRLGLAPRPSQPAPAPEPTGT